MRRYFTRMGVYELNIPRPLYNHLYPKLRRKYPTLTSEEVLDCFKDMGINVEQIKSYQ